MPIVPFREKALRIALKEAQQGVREQGGANTGPRVRQYQAQDGYQPANDTGYAWCASFVNACFAWAGRPLVELKRSASVGFLLTYARERGWVVSVPARGDVFCYESASDSDSWPDHTGLVLRRNPDGSLRTVEGNTSGTSIAEGDGVYVKDRPKWFADRCAYIRVPGETKELPKLVRWAIKDTPEVIKRLKEERKKAKAGG